ncbi:ribosomal protein S18-alanine N-acetyltransferase [Clostridium botulinum]|uniref:[Ribosomal protein bS18]-alanine N-acetyltransferase n=1 Tax=Clostridium botulinum TaxID=1491 RepID=A0A6B4JNG1_CLOBO|nr:ribosomal protein S18-alanine N-acetyltransferase [Clostridium botulinum]MBY6762089.1 ribosomal protein S18-alanine N-acetyltransferase [Clostridium botulinum]MBY6920598.1 ribosomal protein S18-alanine N-acetyltransferase [Clostridium botulinum]MCR1131686.1 ribosomal protein S18-alanine N-acetyltransferase [Clostridium botulinum]NFJ58440.1 ribosomal-protein-alanine N-acetyltransferase [Clostridium botulinum]NFL52036.1 ribosomal-protein-alanine N-acetyltransferase [Clostridium botulinum]
MKLTTSLMTEADIDAVLEISLLSFPTPWSKESYIQELANPLANYIVAKYDNKIIGFIGAWLIIDEVHITNIAVCPDFRRKNVASTLLDSLIEINKKAGCISYTLEVRASNIPAQELYKKYGFVENGIRKNYYQDNKEDAIIMWRIDEKNNS